MPTLTERLAAWAQDATIDDVPGRVREIAVSQVLAHLGALAAGARNELGRKVTAAFGAPFRASSGPKQDAYVLAALTMLLDYDDTVYAGHVTHSTVGVPLAYARPAGLDGVELLMSVLVANEVAARVTAAATLGHFRGQTAAHTHLAGAVAGRGRAEAVGAQVLVDAWGIALAMPPWALHRAFMGSDAKVFTASVPVRTALDAFDAAAVGMRGAPDILEHPDGFLAKFANVPLPDAAVAGLGERWHTETLSIKVYPGCAYLDAALDAAIALHPSVAGRLDEVERVVVTGSIFTVGMNARSAPYVSGASTPVATLSFSVPYNVAVALRDGALTPAHLDRAAIGDAGAWELAGKVEVAYDAALTERAVLATAPVGAALRSAGETAADWLAPLLGRDRDEVAELLGGRPEPSFEHAEKAIGAKVAVHFTGGDVVEASVDIPKGAAGPATRREHRQVARDKWLREGAPWVGEAVAAEVAEIVEALPEAGSGDVERLVTLLGTGSTGPG